MQSSFSKYTMNSLKRDVTEPVFVPPSLEASRLGLAESLFDDEHNENTKAKNFKVVVRIRPFLPREKNAKNCLTIKNDKHVLIDRPSEFGPAKTHQFLFDRIYEEKSSQENIYASAIRPVVMSVLDGYNGSIIAYGQTGTGKTYTIEGKLGDQKGIIPRTGEDVFDYIEHKSDKQSKFLVRTSFLQIYNEKIGDLLNPEGLKQDVIENKNMMKIRENVAGGVFVDGLSEHVVRSPTDIMDLMKLGTAVRETAATKMNRESSRSHAVFTIVIERSEQTPDGEESVTIGRLNLVDLAGSERIRKTGVADNVHLDEMKNINTSLTAFGKVVLALTSPGTHHVPYRDSKLTRILQGSLGGNCKTTMIAAVTAASDSYPETLSSFKFANRAKRVKNFAVVNQDLSHQALLSVYEREIKQLRRALELQQQTPLEVSQIHEQQQQLATEKEEIQDRLLEQTFQYKQARAEKEKLCGQLKALEQKLLFGGDRIEESPEFHAAVEAAQRLLQEEFADKMRELEEERRRLDEEKFAFEREKTELRLQRTKLLQHQESMDSMVLDDTTHPQLLNREDSSYTALMRTTTSMLVDNKEDVVHEECTPSRTEKKERRKKAHNFANAWVKVDSSNNISTSAQTKILGDVRSRSPAPPNSESKPQNTSLRRFRMMRENHPIPKIIDASHSKGQLHQAVSSKEHDKVHQLTNSRSKMAFSDHSQVSSSFTGHLENGSATSTTTDESDLQLRLPDSPSTSNIERCTQHSSNLNSWQSTSPFLQSNDLQLSTHNHLRSSSPQPQAKSTNAALKLSPRQASPITPTLTSGPGSSTQISVTDADDEDDDRDAEQSLDIYVRALRDPQTGIPTRVLNINHKVYRNVFSGDVAAHWFMTNMEGIETIESAQAVGVQMLLLGLYQSLQDNQTFHPTSTHLYQFAEFDSRSSTFRSIPLKTRQVTHSRLNRGKPTGPSAFRSVVRKSWLVTRATRVLSATGIRRSSSDIKPVSLQFVVDDSHPDEGETETVMSPELIRSAGVVVSEKEESSEFDNGASLLHRAAGQGDKMAISRFLETISVNSLDALGRTPLMYACITNKIKAVDMLIRSGADVFLQDSSGRTAVLWSAFYGHHEVLQLLLSRAPKTLDKPDQYKRSALHWACKHISTKTLDSLLEYCKTTIINHPDEDNVTALHWAVLCQHGEHVSHLIRAGASVRIADNEGRTPLHYAVSNDTSNCVRALLAAPDNAVNMRDHRGRTALHLATNTHSPLEMIASLLAASHVDINCTDVRMTTPLHWAAVCNRADICRLLISRGAKLQFRDIAGMTPLHYAIDRNHQECAEVLQMLSSKEVPITDAIFKFSKFHTKSHCAVGVMFTIKEKKREIPLIKEIRLSKKLIPLQKNGGCVCSEISGLSLALETGRY